MLGLLLYIYLAIGCGVLLPSLKLGKSPSVGAAILSGYALTFFLLFLLHVIMRLPVTATVYSTLIIAGIGWFRAYSWLFNHRNLGGPAGVFPVMVIVAVVINGGVNYLPYTVDEFTNWIGVSREIYLHGSYEAIRETVNHPGYLPGWRLLLLLPWVVVGQIDMGLSTMAPLVLHIGLATLIFEIFRFEGERRAYAAKKNAVIWAWTLTLLYLAAEGTGKLWAFNLLIEQPQIYVLTAIFIYLYLLDDAEIQTAQLSIHAGVAIAAGYMIKAAALTVLPGLLLVLLIVFFRETSGDQARWLNSTIRNGISLLLPTVAVVLLWKGTLPEMEGLCLSNPLATMTPEVISNIQKLDWQNLLIRFVTAVVGYIVTYKFVILIIAGVGAAVALTGRKYLWFFAFCTFAFVYFLALYWYHLTCFGDYYFQTLNSIPRFSRVVIQPFHGIGLFALAIFWINFIARDQLVTLSLRQPIRTFLYAGCTTLMVWQGYQLYFTAEDVTTRRYQSVDPRIAEVNAAANFVKHEFPASESPPLVQFISQGTDADLLGYARMYALGGSQGHPRALFRYAPQVSWNPNSPSNIWQVTESERGLTETFKKANVIWPILVDDFVEKALRNLVSAPSCGNKITDYILVKTSNDSFSCQRKLNTRMLVTD